MVPSLTLFERTEYGLDSQLTSRPDPSAKALKHGDLGKQLTSYLEKRILQSTNRTGRGFSWGRSRGRIVSLCDEEAI